jgi:hypothetical protein
VNEKKKAFLRAFYMYKKISPLDFCGELWYDVTVKLGCFARTPPRFGTLTFAQMCCRSKKRVMERAIFGSGRSTLAHLSICVALLSASGFTIACRANLCTVGGGCLTAGRA